MSEDSEIDYVLSGNLIHSTDENPLVVLENGLIGVTKEGKISFVDMISNLETLKKQYNFTQTDITILDKCQFLMPGFVDGSTNPGQITNIGLIANHSEVDWLTQYYFPKESELNDLKLASKTFSEAVQISLRCGTTTAVYRTSINNSTAFELCKVAKKHGQSAFVGKTSVNVNPFDTNYCEVVNITQNAKKCVEEIIKYKDDRIYPMICPLEASYCTPDIIKELSKTAEKFNCPVQINASKTSDENELIKDLFGIYHSSLDMLNRCGTLQNTTSIVHGLYFTDDELLLASSKKVSIVHTPQADIERGFGLLPTRKIMERGINVCLGSDVANGTSFSMFKAMRSAVNVSQTRRINMKEPFHHSVLTHEEAFRMATLNGAKSVGAADLVGNFLPGKYFDALFIDLCSRKNKIHREENELFHVSLARFFACGNEHNIVKVYVSGKVVVNNPENKSVEVY